MSAEPFFYTGLIFVAMNIICSILIIGELRKREVKINFFLLRLLLPKYVHQYREITRQETGKTGILFPVWIISINAALITCILGILLYF